MSNEIFDEKKDRDIQQENILEYGANNDEAIISDNFGQYIADASDASGLQKGQSVREALRMYPQGVMWSLIFSTAIIMEVSTRRLVVVPTNVV
jgi:hypothetical protein